MENFLDLVVDLESSFYNQGFTDGIAYDISGELISVEQEAEREAKNRANLVGHTLGYLDGLDWLVSCDQLKLPTHLQNAMRELRLLCEQVPSINEEHYQDISALLDRIQLLLRKCKTILTVPTGIHLSTVKSKCSKSYDF